MAEVTTQVMPAEPATTKGLKKKDLAEQLVQQRSGLVDQIAKFKANPRSQEKINLDKTPYEGNGGRGNQEEQRQNEERYKLQLLEQDLANLDTKIDQVRSGKNADGSFIRPEFESLINKDTGLLGSQYTLADKWRNIDVNSDAYNKYKTDALRDAGSSSEWGKSMLANAQTNKEANIDNIARQQNASIQNSFDQLASQGGIEGGSRERLAKSGMKDALMGRQDARRNFQVEGNTVKSQDEQARIKMLENTNSMDQQRAQFGVAQQTELMNMRKYDTEKAILAMGTERADEMKAWEKNQENWAAIKQSEAQARASGGCFPKGTLIQMEDGTEMPIEEIKNGDVTELGGMVVGRLIFNDNESDSKVYDYEGVKVTADHAVLENGIWMRVKDAKLSQFIEGLFYNKVYNLITDNHRLVIKDVIFADYEETDIRELSPDESIKAMNDEQDEHARNVS